MGAADIIPGVSGGTVALITGIYERLIDAIKSVNLLFVPYFFRGFVDKKYFKAGRRKFKEGDLKCAHSSRPYWVTSPAELPAMFLRGMLQAATFEMERFLLTQIPHDRPL